jgi:hypothetical protein
MVWHYYRDEVAIDVAGRLDRDIRIISFMAAAFSDRNDCSPE